MGCSAASERCIFHDFAFVLCFGTFIDQGFKASRIGAMLRDRSQEGAMQNKVTPGNKTAKAKKKCSKTCAGVNVQ